MKPETTDKDLILHNEALRKDQDKKIDRLTEATVRTKHVAVDIGAVLDGQNEKLELLDNRIDKNTQVMLRTSDKMRKLIKESSTCSLIILITFEIAALILILIYM